MHCTPPLVRLLRDRGKRSLLAAFGLAVYGVSEDAATAFSMLQWSGQTVMLITLGIFTMIYISVTKSGKDARLPEAGV